MNQLYLLKLISKLLEGENPPKEKIDCAKDIVASLVEFYTPKTSNAQAGFTVNPELDPEAEQARQELYG